MSVTVARQLSTISKLRTACRTLICKRVFNWDSGPENVKEQKYILCKTLNADPKQVYHVVSEVSKYEEFIPYCNESFVNERSPVNGTPTEAGLRVGFRQFDEKFICQVACHTQVGNDKEQFSVVAESISHNLFHVLCCQWIMKPHPHRQQASQVELVLRFKFKSKLYNSVSSIFAKTVTELVMKAFDKRVFEVRKLQLLAARPRLAKKKP